MKKTSIFVLYILFWISLFLPWFTYNAKVMGYCWGTQFALYFVVPLVMIGVPVFSGRSNVILFILAELGAIFNMVFLMWILGSWQEACNINAGFHWADGLHTATPAYWCSLILSVLIMIFLPIKQFRKPQGNANSYT